MNWLERTELLIGKQKLDKLKNSNVLVVGLGGVGGCAAEMLCRAGIGKMTIVDGDIVEVTNRNRQLPALTSTTGKPKVEVVAARLLDINQDLELTMINEFIQDDKTAYLIRSQKFDYVVDAIDTLSPKVFLIYECLQNGLKIVSSMGAGGKLDPEEVKVADISNSYNCRLAKFIRKRLSRLGIKTGFKVVFTSEMTAEDTVRLDEGRNKKSVVGTISYMPSVFGCFIASVVLQDLIG